MSRLMTVFLLVFAPLVALLLAYLGFETLPANRTGWFLIFMGLAYVVGGPLYVLRQRGKPPAKQEERGDLSFWLVQPGFFFAIFGAPLEYLYLPEFLPRTLWMQALGLLMIGAAVILHSSVRQVIRSQFTGHLQIQAEHHLVQTGPYRIVRHPAYLGYLLMTLGVGIGYSSLVACAAVLLLLVPGLVYRIGVEEKLLVNEFGDEYQAYAHKTRRLIPGVW